MCIINSILQNTNVFSQLIVLHYALSKLAKASSHNPKVHRVIKIVGISSLCS